MEATLERDLSQSNLMLGDLCSILKSSAEVTRCRQYKDGMPMEGLSPLLSEYLREVRNQVKRRAASTDAALLSGGQTLYKQMISDELAYPTELGRSYIRAGLMRSAAMYNERAHSTVNTFLQWIVISTVMFVCALLLFFITIYSPMIVSLDADMKRTRSMLLMFPSEVIHSVSAIRDLMNDVAVQMNQQ